MTESEYKEQNERLKKYENAQDKISVIEKKEVRNPERYFVYELCL